MESHDHAIHLKVKAKSMVDHFYEQVIAKGKIDDQALAKAAQGSMCCKQFVENDEFKRFVGDMVFAMTSCWGGCSGSLPSPPEVHEQ